MFSYPKTSTSKVALALVSVLALGPFGLLVPAVFAAADNAITSLLSIATTTPGSPYEKRKSDDLAFEGGRVFVKADGPSGGVPFADLLRRANVRLVSGHGSGPSRDRSARTRIAGHAR